MSKRRHSHHADIDLQSVSRFEYYADAGAGREIQRPRDGADHGEMLANGWKFSARCDRVEPITLDGDGFIGRPELCGFTNAVGFLAACPWPPGEDTERLKDRIAEAHEEARLKVKRCREEGEVAD